MRPEMTLELLAAPAGVSGVRRALRPYGTDVQLCASELVTNVIRHVGETVPVTVRVWREEGGRIRLGVSDPDPRALPVLFAGAGTEAESGRGLALLDALAVRWGVEREGGRKTVWCELFTGADAGSDTGTPKTPERPGRRKPSAGALGPSSARS
ncbi:ATP-binding protein [Streptomyces indiaensis]|uniref:Histidine kinase/HSP90-like ATPase domain-containing protein n=1 Tax=Streptomyces indiaensis TaxID=284033 RepID=A0ABN3DRN2_9ACTN|nr:ATP-binding protein [Streptomyces indiaensis]MCF1644888.1 ATP-binding protein [Streptomyces indiaensis]